MAITLPKTKCECTETDNTTFTPSILPEKCTPCPETTAFSPSEISSVLCDPCPVETPPDLLLPSKENVIVEKTCFSDLINNMAKNKFCDVGPKCK